MKQNKNNRMEKQENYQFASEFYNKVIINHSKIFDS